MAVKKSSPVKEDKKDSDKHEYIVLDYMGNGYRIFAPLEDMVFNTTNQAVEAVRELNDAEPLEYPDDLYIAQITHKISIQTSVTAVGV